MEDSVVANPIKVVRKRRTKQEIAAAAAAAATVDAVAPVVEEKPRRGKKKTQPVVAVVTSSGIQGSFTNFTKRPLIAHLDIKSSDVQFYDEPPKYNPDMSALLKEPEPYALGLDDPFVDTNAEVTAEMPLSEPPTVATSSIIAAQQQQVQQQPQQQTSQPLQRREFGPQNLLVSFGNSAVTKTLPDSTDVYCFWCSHPFEGRPCVIPQICIEGVWKVYGNFCCPSCCLSYMLSETMDTHIRWERISLLTRLYGGHRIYPAPPREVLTVFGGVMSINEYRALIDDHRLRVDVQMPPMVSILSSMDTKPIDFYETSIKNSFVAAAQERLTRAEEGLKLRRTKPLKDRESTLDSVLNISIKTH